MYSSLIDNYSSLNHFQVIKGKKNSFVMESEKYNLTRKELRVLFVKHITRNDIENISIYLKLNSNEDIFVIKECFSIINKSKTMDYKDLLMERIILYGCYYAIKFLKRIIDAIKERKERKEITHHQLEIIKKLVPIRNKLTAQEKQFIWRIWCSRSSIKLTERQSIMLSEIFEKNYLII